MQTTFGGTLLRQQAATRCHAARVVVLSAAAERGERARSGRKRRGDNWEPQDGKDQFFLRDSDAARLRRLLKQGEANSSGVVVDDQEGVVQLPADQSDANGKRQHEGKGGASVRHDSTRGKRGGGAASNSRRGGRSGPARSPLPAGTRSSGSAAAAKPGVPAASPSGIPLLRPSDDDKGTFFCMRSWPEAGASPDTAAALRQLGFTRPSHIQLEAFRALQPSPPAHGGARRQHVALADQAGSGKTLAYLAPLMQQLREQEAALGPGAKATVPSSPRLIVLAPTSELVQQVLRVVRALSGAGLRCRSAAITGGEASEVARHKTMRTQSDMLAEGVDVLVATPGRLLRHLQKGSLVLDATQAVVLDEVDVLCGGEVSYQEHIQPLQEVAPPGLRFVLVSATLPQHTFKELEQLFPGMAAAFGPGLHRTAPGLVEELVDCSGGDDISLESGTQRKIDALFAALDRHRAARAIVFCNKLESCRVVENALQRRARAYSTGGVKGGAGSGAAADGDEGVDDDDDDVDVDTVGEVQAALSSSGSGGGGGLRVLAYHEAIREDLRKQNLVAFLTPAPLASPPRAADAADAAGADEDQQQRMVLVCTDRTSRGIDSVLCEHVVLFDFPRDPSEYVRRVGRTARGAGGRGVVSVLVLGKQVPLARDIIERNSRGVPVHRVPLAAQPER